MRIENKVVNPLDFSGAQIKQDTLTVSLTEPPNTMTYYLDEDLSKSTLSATQFSDWIVSMRKIFSSNDLPMVNWRTSIQYGDGNQMNQSQLNDNQYQANSLNLAAENLKYLSAPSNMPGDNDVVIPHEITDFEYYLNLYTSLLDEWSGFVYESLQLPLAKFQLLFLLIQVRKLTLLSQPLLLSISQG